MKIESFFRMKIEALNSYFPYEPILRAIFRMEIEAIFRMEIEAIRCMKLFFIPYFPYGN